MNYSELTAAIQEYTENTFTADQLALFTEQAEKRIFNTVQFPALRQNVLGTASQGNPYVSCPTDFIAPYSLAVILGNGRYEYLLFKDANFIRAAYPSPAATGQPRYYGLFGPTTTDEPAPQVTNNLSFIVGPTPNNDFLFELHYFYYPKSISKTPSGQSWLGNNYSPVLLYGALIEAYTFMKGEPDILQLYELKYKEALAQAKRLGDALQREDAYRSGQVKLPVT